LGGASIVKMQTGDPDFRTHPNIIDAAHRAMQNGATRYCDSRGLLELRSALQEKLYLDNKIACSATSNILVTHGAVHAIGMALRALLNPGDECVIIEPYWRAYEMSVLLAGARPVIVPASPSNGFRLDVAKIAEVITERTKVIVINSPNNPSGVVYDRDSLVELASLAVSNGIYILSDEVYESIVFNPAGHFSLASDPNFFDYIVTVFSFSKTYAMTGWRIGYLVANAEIVDQILKLSQFSVTSLAPFTQMAALTALTDPEVKNYVAEMVGEYDKRNNRIAAAKKGTWLENEMLETSGAFYSLINMGRFGVSSLELAKLFVDKFGISFTPGIAFGDGMDQYFRMCFATSDQHIDSAMKALLDYDNFVG